jgi:hypothetical protein
MNLKQLISALERLIQLDDDNNITIIEDEIFIMDINRDVTINYNGTLDDLYYVNIDGEVTAI